MTLRLTVTCKPCGERLKVERSIVKPERVYLICSRCETPLRCDITEEQLTKRPSKLFAGLFR